jgi:hypothetical protein
MPLALQVPFLGNLGKMVMTIRTPSKTFNEVHYCNIGDTPVDIGTLPQVKKNAQALAVARSTLLPVNCTLLGWEMSNTAVYRNTIGNSYGTGYGEGATASAENEGNDCLKVRLTSTEAYRRILYMGAIPDLVVGSDIFSPQVSAGWYTALQLYLNLLAGKPAGPAIAPPAGSPTTPFVPFWGSAFQSTDTGASGAYPIGDIQALTWNGTIPPNQFFVTTDVPIKALPGDVVRISKFVGANAGLPMNQLWTVVSGSGLEYILNSWTLPASYGGAFTTQPYNGYIQKVVKVFGFYDSWALQQPGTRNRGNRISTPLGRKRKKRNIGYPG